MGLDQIPAQLKVRFLPYIFDCREAWQATLHDPDYSADMPFAKFMQIYSYHRRRALGGAPIAFPVAEPPKKPSPPPRPKKEQRKSESILLEQSDIDALIAQMGGV